MHAAQNCIVVSTRRIYWINASTLSEGHFKKKKKTAIIQFCLNYRFHGLDSHGTVERVRVFVFRII
jgi:hypothetical protein